MKANRYVLLMLSALTLNLHAAQSLPDTPSTSTTNGAFTTSDQTLPPADGMRPEDVMIDDDAIGDVWDTLAPADAIGITEEQANILPSMTGAISSAELLQEKELLKPPQHRMEQTKRIPTPRWHPNIPFQTLFYLILAVVVVAVLLLKAKG